jgi:hypothetical protein|tara:strand:- start:5532 stop:7946 length:2415 start_codon:yes stop_codon:yes gene_type:complete
MAERIVSPGVFTREKDLSFLPQGIGEIGAALVGQSIKGPAFVPTKVESFQEFQQVFGGLTEESYLPYTAQSYLEEAGTATIVRVLGSSGYTVETLNLIVSSSAGQKVAAVLHPTTKVLHADNANSINSLDNSVVVNLNESAAAGGTAASASIFALHLSASGAIPVLSASAQLAVPTGSMNPTANNYIVNTFGYSPKNDGQYAYVYQEFSTFASQSFATGETVTVSVNTSSVDYTKAYSHATTPYIISQDVSGVTKNLFRFHTLSHGNPTNYEFKIGIRDIKPASEVPGSEYGTFTVLVRRVDTSKIPNSVFGQTVQDSDTRPSIIEEFSGVNLDPNSPNYIKRVIGDKDIQIDANGKVILNGDYPNASKHIRVEVDSDVDSGANNSTLVPFGFAKLTSPLPSGVTLPAPSYNVSQSISNEYNKRAFLGYSYDFSTTDNLNYLSPTPDSVTTTVGDKFLLSNCESNGAAIALNDGLIDNKKFLVPFQGGFDGFQPNRKVFVGSSIVAGNSQGLDMSSATAGGTVAYRKAINALSNPDEYDMNMLVLPGVINRLHSSVTTFAKDMVEDRQDAFYLMDAGAYQDSIATVVNSLTSFDSNYVGTYHPWVKILDTDKNKPIWVPPSVVIPGVIAFNDAVAEPWFAPAGLNRGGLPNVIEVKTRLTHTERDTLYENRINPIATFPGQGATVFGQKTLQAKPSALDRINVRRLLIALKKFIASSSRYLIFENNTAATRNRFLSIVNPYLESVQQRQGLFAFRVIMDESNNTPDVIDRNILKGEIFIQPAKTAEFIVLDFNVLPTGAAFPEG